MIRYSLVCREDHGFEAWFRDSAAFDEQSRESLVGCPRCGTSEVRKALMAPAVRTAKSPVRPTEVGPPPVAPAAGAVADASMPMAAALDDERSHHLRGLIRELHVKVRAQADDVGSGFSEEARKIHGGEVPARPIYGTATGEEARALVEDGIEIMPLPPMPDERN
ncbi:MAG TPA: DUF1178 family protein [Lichenihabitans sp.]|jgi:hypothetical protein|nr:DUF1178 family protein [Lichenihabitans sp.]